MKNKKIVFIIVLIIILSIVAILLLTNKSKPDDDNVLYTIQFGSTKLRFVRYDCSLGQNQIVGVEKSIDEGKNYESLTSEPITVSMKPKFVFINENLGFAISKSNLTKTNNYMGLKVTQDGGKTFVDGKIIYDNPNIEILTIEDVPYKENDLLKLPCSIYQVKSDQSSYEDIKLLFISSDNGLTWNLDNIKDVDFVLKDGTISKKGATFILKNNTNKEYSYGQEYIIEKNENGSWKEVDTLTGNPLTWNLIAYSLKDKEQKVINVDWSIGYGELKKGEYRLKKYIFQDEDRPIDESKKIYLYAQFSIK